MKTIFYQLRGTHFKELRAADVAQSSVEPVADPAPTALTKGKGGDEFDTLNAEELHVANGMGVSHEDYFKERYGRKMKTPENANAD